jgi:hypothetical protein
MLATVGALGAGVGAMAQGGRIAHRASEEWMVLRVAFQAAAVALVLLSFLG